MRQAYNNSLCGWKKARKLNKKAFESNDDNLYIREKNLLCNESKKHKKDKNEILLGKEIKIKNWIFFFFSLQRFSRKKIEEIDVNLGNFDGDRLKSYKGRDELYHELKIFRSVCESL